MSEEGKIRCKLFAGCLITAELRLLLNQSLLWKQKTIDSSSQLVETHFHQKDYIGIFLNQNTATLEELRIIDAKISQNLKTYCPQFASEKLPVLVFSQVFIS